MQRNLRTSAPFLASALAATIVTGCCCTVRVSSDGKPHGYGLDAGVRNGAPHDAGIEVIRFDDMAYGFVSSSTITPRGGPFRLHLRSAEPAPAPCEKGVYPDFVTHYEPSERMEAVTVEFASPPVVDFASGWLYFKGKAPIGKTRRVRAIGSGTEMLIEIAADADYIYVLGEATSQVYVSAVQPDGTEVACTTLSVGQCLAVRDEIDAAGALIKCVCGTPTAYMDGGARQAFVTNALARIAEQAWK